MARWTARDIPDQAGRRAVVTGASSGLGLVTARELARAGASVVLAVRHADRGAAAAAQVRAAAREPGGVTVEIVDLADLSSVRACAERMVAEGAAVDLLINNAGVMAPPRRVTVDGFESQFATNYLGHFALTGLLMGLLRSAPSARVVTLTSILHRLGWLRFGDLQMQRRYHNWLAYGQSKLADLMFALELQRRAGTGLLSLAAHPGYAATNLQTSGPATGLERAGLAAMNRVVAQSADMGALPTLYAATVPGITGGSLVGPGGVMEMRGHPQVTHGARRAYDEAAARRLWEESERLTGVTYGMSVAA
jgi:NAD(P)-dependent dehydrogenase (short-subunit alcohol dehydrogenase family)